MTKQEFMKRVEDGLAFGYSEVKEGKRVVHVIFLEDENGFGSCAMANVFESTYISYITKEELLEELESMIEGAECDIPPC